MRTIGPNSRICRAVLAASAVLAACGQAFGQAGAPSPKQLAQWVQELDADEFLARENAMLGLIDAGPAAIAVLKDMPEPPRSIEAATRITHVLQALGTSPDFDVQEQARAALAELAARKEMPQIARRAAFTLEALNERRAAQSIAELETLGAQIVRGENFNGFSLEEYIESIEIGPDFRGSEQDLRRLKWLPETKVLMFVGPRATDGWLKHAAAMERLSELHLYEAATTDAGLATLANHASLTEIGLYYTPLTDEGLAHLQKLPALNFVKLYGTKATREGVEKFQTASGLAKVDHRNGAFLGVGCMQLDGFCILSTVHRDSPAARAGLEHDDRLVRFGDTKVTDFESLTAEISQRNVGNDVEVEVQRKGLDDQGNTVYRTVVTQVKLGPWDLKAAVDNGMRP
jgi:hypothetical protein